MHKTVSVALTTYNGQRFLLDQLESIASQTHRPDEVVIADDRSTDGTVSIIRRFSVGAPFPVKLHSNPARLGWARNFVHVAERCSGDLIAFCDQDDVWQPNKLERCLAEFSASEDVDLVYHDALTVDAGLAPYGHLRRLPLKSREATAFDLQPFRNPYGFSVVFRQRLLRFCGLHESSLDPDRDGQPMAHDQFFFFLASALGRVRYVPEPLVKYRQHGGNVVGPGVPRPLSYRLRGITEAQCSLRAAAAGSRAGMLEQMIRTTTAEEASNLERLRDRYVKLAEAYTLRGVIHSHSTLRTRVAALARLAPKAYSSHPWAFGWKEFLKDSYAALETSFGVTIENAITAAFSKIRDIFMSLAKGARR
jgi:Glycosyl transferase family 2